MKVDASYYLERDIAWIIDRQVLWNQALDKRDRSLARPRINEDTESGWCRNTSSASFSRWAQVRQTGMTIDSVTPMTAMATSSPAMA